MCLPTPPSWPVLCKSSLMLRKHVRFSPLPSPTVIRDGGWKQMFNLHDVLWSQLSLNPNRLDILLLFEIGW